MCPQKINVETEDRSRCFSFAGEIGYFLNYYVSRMACLLLNLHVWRTVYEVARVHMCVPVSLSC